MAAATALVARYCDHVEHAEEAPIVWLADAARELRDVGIAVAGALGVDVWQAYAARLEAMESRRAFSGDRPFDGPAALRAARTWADVQRIQDEHDRYYRPDVYGLARSDQIRHSLLHLAKILGGLVAALDDPDSLRDFEERWLPDIVLFGVKLSTIIGQALDEESLPWRTRLEAASGD